MRVVLAAAVVLALAAPPARAVTIADHRGHQVARHLGTTMWSERGNDGRYHLTSREGRVRVDPLARPFDVDLGTDARGRSVAVYSRCREGRRACRIHLYDIAAGRETTLYPGHRPAIRQGIIAFARLRADGRDAIFIRRMGPKGRARRIHVLPRSLPATTGLDLGAGGLAFSAAGDGTRMYLRAPGGRVRVLAYGTFAGGRREVHASPSFAGRFLHWAFSDRHPTARANGYAIRRDVRARRTVAARTAGYLESLAADAARPGNPLMLATYSTRLGGGERVFTFDRPRWRTPPAQLGVSRR
jgi:hypothetical protein